MRSWWRGRPLLLDAALALGVLVVGLATVHAEVSSSATDGSSGRLHPVDTAAYLVIVLCSAPVVLRRRAVWVAYLVLLGAALGGTLADYPIGAASLSGLIMLYTTGAQLERVGAVVALALGLAGYVAITLLDVYKDTFVNATINAGFYIAAWTLGRSMRYRRAYVAELQARAERLEREHDDDLRATLAEERARIARELHDVVAHSLSVMTVQAAAAQRMLDRDPGRTREAMAAVEATGRGALAEMRRIVGVLRETGGGAGGGPAALTPQPGVADLPHLISMVREAGLPVETDLGDLVSLPHGFLPAGVDLTVYRVVQEALTNTLKHAGPTSARVRVAALPGGVTVDVEDSGRGAAAALESPPPGRSGPRAGSRSGHGLVGMQERVALYGGTLHVGPRPGGGFAVHAVIPVEQQVPRVPVASPAPVDEVPQ
jgi:signal transduction histidine kinase